MFYRYILESGGLPGVGESGEEFLGRTRWKFAFRADGADGQILLGQTFAKLL